MEGANELAKTEPGAAEAAPASVPASWPISLSGLPRWVAPSVLAHGTLLGTLFFVARDFQSSVESKLDGIGSQTADAAKEIGSLEQRSTELEARTDDLKTEIVQLRQFLASRSNEDVIYLKTLILKPDIDPTLARTVAKNVHHYAELYGRDANLVLAIIEVESDFNPKAVSNVGATGLMQVMPQWKKVLGIDGELTNPEVSIKYGLQILGFYTEMYKDLDMALTAYNRGPGPVDMALMRGQDPKNGYAPRVLQAYDRLKKLTVSSQLAQN